MWKNTIKPILILGLIILALLNGCTGSNKSASPEETVKAYIQALVNKDSNTISSLSCADWEVIALMEYDSLQAVTVRLDGLDCSNIGNDGEYIFVNCAGNIIATYNGEDQSIDLSSRIYKVLTQNSDYQVCGYK